MYSVNTEIIAHHARVACDKAREAYDAALTAYNRANAGHDTYYRAAQVAYNTYVDAEALAITLTHNAEYYRAKELRRLLRRSLVIRGRSLARMDAFVDAL